MPGELVSEKRLRELRWDEATKNRLFFGLDTRMGEGGFHGGRTPQHGKKRTWVCERSGMEGKRRVGWKDGEKNHRENLLRWVKRLRREQTVFFGKFVGGGMEGSKGDKERDHQRNAPGKKKGKNLVFYLSLKIKERTRGGKGKKSLGKNGFGVAGGKAKTKRNCFCLVLEKKGKGKVKKESSSRHFWKREKKGKVTQKKKWKNGTPKVKKGGGG